LQSDQSSLNADTLKNDGKCVKYNLRHEDDDDDDDDDADENENNHEDSENDDDDDDYDDEDYKDVNETQDFNQDSIDQNEACYDSDNVSTLANDSIIHQKETNMNWLPNNKRNGRDNSDFSKDDIKNQMKLALCDNKKDKYQVESEKKIKNAIDNNKMLCKNIAKPIEKIQKNLENKNKMQIKSNLSTNIF
jgi:hypothetical protein